MKLTSPQKIKLQAKYIYLLAGGIALLALLLSLSLSGKKPAVYAFADLSGLEQEEVRRLTIKNSATGEELEVDDKGEIAALLDILTPLAFQEERVSGPLSNWTHLLELHHDAGNFLRLAFAGKSAHFSFYQQGEQITEKRYGINEDITPLLEAYFALLREIQERAQKEAEEKTPVATTVQEIEPAICVVINNHPSARPSSGLQQADTVYEFLVEGGTTRYLAVFKRKHLENFIIGPVRSLRPYLAVQSLEYGGIIAHSGYSARTMQMVSGLGLFQIADIGDNFWRDRTRQAPHNLYTSIDSLYRISLKRIQPVERTYVRQELPAPYQEGKYIEINYSGHNRVSYRYDEEKGVYYRYINGAPHTDRETGNQYFAERVIVRETLHHNVPGPEGLVDIELQGSGGGLLYEKGRKYNITWKNTGKETNFYCGNGALVQPIPGSTWIQVVR